MTGLSGKHLHLMKKQIQKKSFRKSWFRFLTYTAFPILTHLLQTFMFTPANLTNTPFQTLGGFLYNDIYL